MKGIEITEVKVDALFEKIAGLIEESRKKVSSAINIAEVYTKYSIGKYIVEDEQDGKFRASYGKQVLEQLAKKLEDSFGDGWSVETLKRCRKFYSIYSIPQIGSTVLTELNVENSITNLVNSVDQIQISTAEYHKFVLSWSHYLILMRISDANARNFYEIECAKQNWSMK